MLTAPLERPGQQRYRGRRLFTGLKRRANSDNGLSITTCLRKRFRPEVPPETQSTLLGLRKMSVLSPQTEPKRTLIVALSQIVIL
jgi:hypothetical protein